jgi:ABC-type siderophore export system fused ATPase/permease subunit
MNFWRLLNARIRNGRARVLTVMFVVALATGAVVVGLSEQLVIDPVWEIPAGAGGALLAVTAATYGQIWASTRVGQWMAGLSRQIRRSVLLGYVALEPSAMAEIDKDAARDSLVALPRGVARLEAEVPAALQSFVTTLVCIAVALVINPVAGTALLLSLKLGAIATTALIVRARGGDAVRQAGDASVDRAMDGTLRGIRGARLAAPSASSGNETALEIAVAARRSSRTRGLAWIATEGAAGAVGRPLLAALLVGATRLSGEASDQAAAMLLIAFLVPLDWIEAIPRLTVLSAAADRLAAFESALHAAVRRWPPPSAAAVGTFNSVELREAIFRYPAHPGQPGAIVGPVSCRVAPGRVLFVTGGTGSGKTSVLMMLAGLATPEGGLVLRDGSPADARRHRDLAAFVATDPVLFAGMIIPEAGRLIVQWLIEELDLGGFAAIKAGRVPDLAELPLAVRSRVSLLIAVAEDRPLLLFDEWDARQTLAMRERYYGAVLPRLREDGRAIVVATNDDRYMHLADGILRLADGRQVG